MSKKFPVINIRKKNHSKLVINEPSIIQNTQGPISVPQQNPPEYDSDNSGHPSLSIFRSTTPGPLSNLETSDRIILRNINGNDSKDEKLEDSKNTGDMITTGDNYVSDNGSLVNINRKNYIGDNYYYSTANISLNFRSGPPPESDDTNEKNTENDSKSSTQYGGESSPQSDNSSSSQNSVSSNNPPSQSSSSYRSVPFYSGPNSTRLNGFYRLENVPEDTPFIVQYHNTNSRLHFGFKDHIDFFTFMYKYVPDNLRMFNEYIRNDSIQKLRLDLDWPDISPDESESSKDIIISEVIDYLKETNDISLDLTTDLILLTCHRPYCPPKSSKQSYHIIINNYAVFNKREAIEFIRQIKVRLKDKLPTKLLDGIDPLTGNFLRTFNSVKPESPSCPFVFSDKWIYKGKTIDHKFSETHEYIHKGTSSTITVFDHFNILKIDVPESTRKSIPLPDGLDETKLNDLLAQLIPGCYIDKLDDKSGYINLYTPYGECKLCKRSHDRTSRSYGLLYLKVGSNNKVYLRCGRKDLDDYETDPKNKSIELCNLNPDVTPNNHSPIESVHSVDDELDEFDELFDVDDETLNTNVTPNNHSPTKKNFGTPTRPILPVDDKLFGVDDETLANICLTHSYIPNFWVSLDDTGDILYTYNEDITIWCSKNHGYTIHTLRQELTIILQTTLHPIIKNLISRLMKVKKHSEAAEVLKMRLGFFKGIFSSVGNVGKALSIAKVISSKLFLIERQRIQSTGYGFIYQSIYKNLDFFPIADNIKVNLKTKERTPRVQTDYFTWTTDIPNLPLADQSKALQFIKDIMWDTYDHPRPELTQFQLIFLGYCITGRVSSKIGVWDIGPEANNGKTTKMTIMKDVVGSDICGEVPKEVVVEAQGKSTAGGTSSHLVLMRGKRFVWTSEIKKGDKVNEPQYKAITGMDNLPARDLWETHVDAASRNIQNTCKIILMANDPPDYSFEDKGLLSRIVINPHDRVFTDNPTKPYEMKAVNLDKLRDEFRLPENRAGYFNMLVDNSSRWYYIDGSKIPIPEICQMATINHRITSDSVKAYYDEACQYKDTTYDDICAGGKLYNNFQSWCKETGMTSVSNKLFGERFFKYHKNAIKLSDEILKTKSYGVQTYRYLKILYNPELQYLN